MAEQTFRSPGFFEQEIDLAQREQAPIGTPAGIIGTADKGPAFVPVIIGSFSDFKTKFGDVNPDRFGPYAVKEYLNYKDAVTFMRVLGAGSNDTDAEIQNTIDYGFVSKAGFAFSSSFNGVNGLENGMPQFIVAKHYVSTSGEPQGFPVFSDNNSFDLGGSDAAEDNIIYLTRGVIFTTTGSRAMVADWNTVMSASVVNQTTNYALRNDDTSSQIYRGFKLIISSSSGTPFAKDDDLTGVKIFTASLDPSQENYISRVLNTDPDKFQSLEHYLYLDYAVEDELAPVAGRPYSIAIISGSANENTVGAQGDYWKTSFGRFDTRYQTPHTPTIISQPFGDAEWNLFHFETLSDGAYGNNKIKISIANLRASTDVNDTFGTFEVQVRNFTDTDLAPQVLESYPDCNLNPKSDRYVAQQIGDKKVKFNFDASDVEERRLLISGKYPNRSNYVRVVMNLAVDNEDVPQDSLPFGFRGPEVIKTTNTLTDNATGLTGSFGTLVGNEERNDLRVAKSLGALNADGDPLNWYVTASIAPPLPYRFKVTRGAISTGTDYAGQVGAKERADRRLYWGVKYERMPLAANTTTPVLNANVSSLPNPLITAYAKFNGISKLDNVVTGSGKDAFNSNKFTLARVALYNQLQSGHISHITGSAKEHMLEAAYIRNGIWDANDYTMTDTVRTGRITLATLVQSSSVKFNRFQAYAKFNVLMQGGFEGVNILDKDNRLLTDRGASTDLGGKAGETYTNGLGIVGTNNAAMSGKGIQNNIIFSYRTAVEIMTDPMTVNTNLFAVPGIRDQFITNFGMDRSRDYSMQMFVMDIQEYDESSNRLFEDDTAKRDVRATSEEFETRRVDNNYAAAYFPDVYIKDDTNKRNVLVPSSVVALGALAYNDSVAYPWFAPAGFNRGALDAVTNTAVRLTSADRDTLYDSRINPIANFPNGGFVIFGQKTLQLAKTALDRVNVRRLMLELKRLVVQVADKLLFEPNNVATRARFIGQVAPILALVQSQQGIEKFAVIMDDTNNTPEDMEQNKLNGRIVVVPTRAIEFIAIDFIITNSGISFE